MDRARDCRKGLAYMFNKQVLNGFNMYNLITNPILEEGYKLT